MLKSLLTAIGLSSKPAVEPEEISDNITEETPIMAALREAMYSNSFMRENNLVFLRAQDPKNNISVEEVDEGYYEELEARKSDNSYTREVFSADSLHQIEAGKRGERLFAAVEKMGFPESELIIGASISINIGREDDSGFTLKQYSQALKQIEQQIVKSERALAPILSHPEVQADRQVEMRVRRMSLAYKSAADIRIGTAHTIKTFKDMFPVDFLAAEANSKPPRRKKENPPKPEVIELSPEQEAQMEKATKIQMMEELLVTADTLSDDMRTLIRDVDEQNSAIKKAVTLSLAENTENVSILAAEIDELTDLSASFAIARENAGFNATVWRQSGVDLDTISDLPAKPEAVMEPKIDEELAEFTAEKVTSDEVQDAFQSIRELKNQISFAVACNVDGADDLKAELKRRAATLNVQEETLLQRAGRLQIRQNFVASVEKAAEDHEALGDQIHQRRLDLQHALTIAPAVV